MFDSIRQHKKYLMGFLLILIIPSFVLVGVEGYARFNEQGEEVARVDGKPIRKPDWDRAHEQEVQRLREQMPQLDVRLLESEAARYGSLERMVREQVLALAANDLRLYTGDQRLARELARNEAIAALRRPDGSLDVQAYRDLLARQGLTPEQFEANVRVSLSQQRLLQGLESTAFLPTPVARLTLDAYLQRREVRLASFPASVHVAQVKPTEADLERFHRDHASLFQVPELLDVEYVVLDVAALEQAVKLDEQEVRRYYEQNASRLSGGEERRARHLLLTVPPGASAEQKTAVRARADELLKVARANPSDFSRLAKEHSQDPGSAEAGGDLGFFARGAMVKPFEDAVFAMKAGEISEVVETDFGFHLIELVEVKSPPVKPFESLRAELERDLRRQQAQRQFAEAAETFSNLVYEEADSFKPVVDRLGLVVRTAQGVQRRPQSDAGPLGHERLLEALFAPDSIEKRHNTSAIEVGAGQLAAARVMAHTPARVRALEEVRETVRLRVTAQQAASLAREAGEKALAAARDQSTLPTGLQGAQIVSRDSAVGLPPKVLSAVLSADPTRLPAWIGVDLGDAGYAVVQVLSVQAPPAQEPAALDAAARQVAQAWRGAEVQAYYETLKERYKVRMLVKAPEQAARDE